MKNIITLLTTTLLLSFNTSVLAQCANFTFSVSNSTVTFNNTSTCTGVNFSNWYFGDGNSTLFNNNPMHTYNATGTYWVRMDLVDSSNNVIDTMAMPVTITSLTPTGNCADFTYSVSSSIPHLVAFTNTSACVGATDYLWVFGDGDSSRQFNTSHYYNFTGSFCPKLYVYDSVGFPIDTAVYCLPRIVRGTFVQGYVHNNGGAAINVKLTCTLSNNSTYVDNDLCNHSNGYYSFGIYQELKDNSTVTVELIDCDSVIQDSSFTYHHPSIANPSQHYNADLQWCDPLMASFTKSQSMSNGNPVPGQIDITDNSTGHIQNYLWDFGDGNSSTQVSPSHSYAGNGPYLLCLTVSDSINSDTYCDSVSIDTNGMLLRRAPGFTINVGGYSGPSGIASAAQTVSFDLYPVPTNDVLNIKFGNVAAEQVVIEVINQQGQLMSSQAMAITSNQTAKLDVSNLVKGIYILQVKTIDKIETKRFIIK